MSTRLADLFPQPKMLTLGGVPYAVSQLQIRDLAALDAKQGDGTPPQRSPDFDSDDPAVRRAARRAAYAAAERPETDATEETTEDAAARSVQVLWLSLRKASPHLSLDAVLDIAAAMTPDEWREFTRIAWNTDPIEEATEEIYAELGIVIPKSTNDECTWPEAFMMARRTYGLSLKQFGDLTLSQWEILRLCGQPKDRSIQIPPGWSDERFEKEVLGPLSEFWAEGEATPESHACEEDVP